VLLDLGSPIFKHRDSSPLRPTFLEFQIVASPQQHGLMVDDLLSHLASMQVPRLAISQYGGQELAGP